MTNLVVSSDFNLSNPQDFFGNHPVQSNHTSTGFDVYAPDVGNYIHVSGQNIQYDSNSHASSGTVTSIVCLTGNGQETLFNMTGANISIQYDNNQDWTSFGQELNYWLGSNPTITTISGGLNGAETISAPAGTNQVYGYTGHNTVVYNTSSTQFTINVNDLLSSANGTLTVTQGDPVVSNNTNTLHAVQSIQFSDRTVDTSWLTKASTLYATDAAEFNALSEMYLAYFNRAPDSVGLDYWASQAWDWHTAGLSNSKINGDIANIFSGTAEAISTFGTVTSQSSVAQLQTFVTKVYNNVLDRSPEQAGLNYWVDMLQTGKSTPGGFISNLINAVNAQAGSADSIYLNSKAAVGNYFGLTNGLTDAAQAQNVMTKFNSVYETSGVSAAITAANTLTDSYASGAGLTAHPELIVHLVGIHG